MVTQVRPMVAADASAVAAIEIEANPLPWKAADFLAFMEEGTVGGQQKRAWVCADPVIRGFACVAAAAGEAELQSLAVSRRFWGQGMATALLEAAMEWTRGAGHGVLHLEVREGNARALALYRRLGFEPTGRRPRYYQDSGEDAILMSKRLA